MRGEASHKVSIIKMLKCHCLNIFFCLLLLELEIQEKKVSQRAHSSNFNFNYGTGLSLVLRLRLHHVQVARITLYPTLLPLESILSVTDWFG